MEVPKTQRLVPGHPGSERVEICLSPGGIEGVSSLFHAWRCRSWQRGSFFPSWAGYQGSQREGYLTGDYAQVNPCLPGLEEVLAGREGSPRTAVWPAGKALQAPGSWHLPLTEGSRPGPGEAWVSGNAHQHIRYCLISKLQRRPGSKGRILLLVMKCSLVKYEKCLRNEFPSHGETDVGFFFFFFFF